VCQNPSGVTLLECTGSVRISGVFDRILAATFY
jgi:hypothetical protein